jgi:hypothetical protein
MYQYPRPDPSIAPVLLRVNRVPNTRVLGLPSALPICRDPIHNRNLGKRLIISGTFLLGVGSIGGPNGRRLARVGGFHLLFVEGFHVFALEGVFFEHGGVIVDRVGVETHLERENTEELEERAHMGRDGGDDDRDVKNEASREVKYVFAFGEEITANMGCVCGITREA